MSHDDLIHELLRERFGKPVREWKPADRPRPLADQLDDLRDHSPAILTVLDGTG